MGIDPGLSGAVELPVERLRAVLQYEPYSEVFTWREPTNWRIRSGDLAGSPDYKGYLCIKINKRLYKAHRLAWLYMTGTWPRGQIDHKNTDKCDNRFSNLREATQSQNMANRRALRNNKYEVKGVCRRKNNKWYAKIGASHLGCFITIEEAHAAYISAARLTFADFARSS